MIETLPTTPVPGWDSEDARKLRELLESATFKKALRIILDEQPELLDGADVNKTLVRNGEVKGFSAALTSIYRLTFEQPEAQINSTVYPDIDDERFWKEQTQQSE